MSLVLGDRQAMRSRPGSMEAQIGNNGRYRFVTGRELSLGVMTLLAAYRTRAAAAVAMLTILALFAAGCGGGSPGASVADLGTSTTSTTTTTQSGSSHEGSAGAGSSTPSGPSSSSSASDCASVTTCYTPHQFEVAYGITSLLARGIDGRGETVVLPELAASQSSPLGASDLRQDFARFDSLFGLPAARLRVVSRLAGAASPWLADGEEVLDAEMVHAVAPRAAITIVLVKLASLDSAASGVAASVAAIRLGLSEGGVISISAAGQTGGEHCDTPSEVARLNSILKLAADRHVTVVAASGDVGAVGEPCHLIQGLTGGSFSPVREANLPASDPFVLAAGGTTLTASHKTGAYIGETAWGLPFGNPGSQFQASGGGFSRRLSRPSYQNGVPGIGVDRGVPDVAADAAPHTGMGLAISDGGSHYTIRASGGTSATAPLWAGLIALADQYAGRHLGFINPALYRIGRSNLYRKAFHDITTGTNKPTFPGKTINGYKAAPGWDPVTGWGSPNAQALVPLFARLRHLLPHGER